MATASTSQGNDWRFIAPLNVNQTTENPVSCVRFDPHEELIWIGSSTGKVSGFLPTSHCSRYSAFVVSKISAVHSLEPTESVVFSLSDTVLRANTKQGIPVAKYTSPSMTKMAASCQIPGTSTFILGGRQQKLIHYDFIKEKEIRTAEISENAAVIIRYNGANAFTADDSGNVHIRNAKNCETIHSINCHGDRILDFDVQGNKMITCGVSLNFSRLKNTDQFMKVYDLRMYKALPPIGIPMPPRFVRFMPSYCERVCITYQMAAAPNMPREWAQPAGIRMFDLNSQGNCASFPIESAPISAFDFSSTKHFIAVGSQCGLVSVFADRDHPVLNENSKETLFAAPPAQPPLSFAIDDISQTLASIPMPFPHESLVSDWPSEYTQIIHRRKKPVGEHANVKVVHYATQVKNPRVNSKLKRHNIVPYFLEDAAPVIERGEDKSSSDEEKPPASKVKVSRLYKKRPPPIAQGHHRRDVESSQNETYVWNLTDHLTLQASFAMSLLANSAVHLVYALSPLKSYVFGHICEKDWCLTCELRFLFTTFDAKLTCPIATTNLAWALVRHGVSLRAGGVLHCTQTVARTIMAAAIAGDGIVASSLERHQRCVRCGAQQANEEEREHVVTLNYTTIQQASMCQLMEKALHLCPAEERECEECKQTTRMECKRKVRELSPLLIVDTNSSSSGYFDFWRRQMATFERRPGESNRLTFANFPESPSEKKRCRYGADCRNKKACKFAHGRIDWSGEQTKLLEDVDALGWNHYVPSRIAAQICEGIVRLSDISELPDYDEPTAQIYELDAMLDVIGNGEHTVQWTHPVTLLRENAVSSTAWTMINEQLVSRLHEHQARHLDARWKLPIILVYKLRGFEVDTPVTPIPEELFFCEQNLAENGAESPAIRDMDSLPKQGELVGLDAEFIKIKTDLLEFDGKVVQMRAVGRASCVDSAGEKIIFDDHVKLADDVEVMDYLTRYSGIVEADLSTTSSEKYLTSHKRLLLRMHVLLQRGVVFVGHALHNDFTVLNIHVAEPQIIDTVVLMRLGQNRFLSLQCLTRDILGELIQDGVHDSVEDAKYALKLYRKYLVISEQGTLESELRRVYATACPSPNHSASPLIVSTLRKTPEDLAAAESAPKSI